MPSWETVPGTVAGVNNYCSESSSCVRRRLCISQGSNSCSWNHLRSITETQPLGLTPTGLHSEAEAQRLTGATRQKHPGAAEGSVESARLQFESRTCHLSHGLGAEPPELWSHICRVERTEGPADPVGGDTASRRPSLRGRGSVSPPSLLNLRERV